MSKDKRPIRAVRVGDWLKPYGAPDFAAFGAIKSGEPVEITVKQRRSLPQLQSYWVMLDKVVKAADTGYPTPEKLHDAIKWELGYTTTIYALDGYARTTLDSVAFNKMTAPEFREFYAKAEKLIAERFGIDVEELRKEAA